MVRSVMKVHFLTILLTNKEDLKITYKVKKW